MLGHDCVAPLANVSKEWLSSRSQSAPFVKWVAVENLLYGFDNLVVPSA